MIVPLAMIRNSPTAMAGTARYAVPTVRNIRLKIRLEREHDCMGAHALKFRACAAATERGIAGGIKSVAEAQGNTLAQHKPHAGRCLIGKNDIRRGAVNERESGEGAVKLKIMRVKYRIRAPTPAADIRNDV